MQDDINVYANPDWLALVASVHTTPDDDLPRSVAADWLDDRGQHNHAAFIREQLELDRLEREDGGVRLPLHNVDRLEEPDRNRVKNLLAGHERRSDELSANGVTWFSLGWLPESVTLYEFVPNDPLDSEPTDLFLNKDLVLVARRGFIDTVFVSEENLWAKIGPQLVKQHRILRLFIELFNDEDDQGGWGLSQHDDWERREERASDLLAWSYYESKLLS